MLGLQRHKCNTCIKGVSGSTAAKSQAKVCLSLKSNNSDYCFNTDALILPKVTSNLPSFELQETNWAHIRDLILADPLYFEPREVDIILRSDICAMLRLTGKEKVRNEHHMPLKPKLVGFIQPKIGNWLDSSRES